MAIIDLGPCECCGGGYCGCTNLLPANSSVTCEIKNLALTTHSKINPAAYDAINAGCDAESILSEVDTGPFSFNFFEYNWYCSSVERPFPDNCWSPLFTQYPQYIPGGGETFYDPVQKNFLRYVCNSTGDAVNGLLHFQMQTALFQLPCQQDYVTYAAFEPVDNFLFITNWFGAGFVESSALFCSLISGQTVSLDSAPLTGYHVVRAKRKNYTPDFFIYGQRSILCTIELTLNNLP